MDCTGVETVRFGLGNKVALAVCLILLFAGLFFANYRENGGELLGVNIFKQKSRLFMEGGTFKSPRKRKRYPLVLEKK